MTALNRDADSGVAGSPSMTVELFVEKWAYQARTKNPTLLSEMTADLTSLLAQHEQEVMDVVKTAHALCLRDGVDKSYDRGIPIWEDRLYSLVSLYDMQRFYGEKFFEIIKELAVTETLTEEYVKKDPSFGERKFTDEDKQIVNSNLGKIEYDCNAIGLTVTCAQLRTIKSRVNSGACTYGEITNFMRTLREVITSEMSTVLLLHIDPRKADYFQNASLFESLVNQKFPSTAYDIEEAGKCLACNRNTATVFHLMRIMEAGLHALAKSLNDPSLHPKQNPNWEIMLRKCDEELKKPLKDRSAEWKNDETFFSQAVANLRAVKDAWRNPTMHVKEKYTDEEAQDIYLAVRGFMRHLATKLGK